MKILIDIGHPAHVHYFKNLINILEQNNHNVIVSAREKDITFELLRSYNIPFINRGSGSDSLLGKLFYLFKTNIALYKTCLIEVPDLFIGFGSPYAAQVARFLGKPSIILDDTENAKIGQLFYKYFATTILSPSTFFKNFGQKHIKFNGYMELTYLHNRHFSPDKEILKELGVTDDQKYTILRFVSWNANHDLGHSGISYGNKLRALKEFSKFGKVFISSESELTGELKKYQFNLPPNKMHDAIFYASLVFGESATMASEAACLGVPAIYVDTIGRGYTDEEEKKYKLVFNFKEVANSQFSSIKKGINILESDKIIWKQRQKTMLSEKIDTTSFLAWLIENYPKSITILRNDPSYQYNFK